MLEAYDSTIALQSNGNKALGLNVNLADLGSYERRNFVINSYLSFSSKSKHD